MRRLLTCVRSVLVSVLCLAGSAIPLHADELDELEKLRVQVHALVAAGRYREAEPIAKHAVARAERSFQDQPEVIATLLANLALVYRNQGRNSEAEHLYQRALAIREKVLGDRSPDVANTLNNLANLYNTEGRYAEAESLYRRALTIYAKAPDDQNQGIANSLNNLAALYFSQGRYADAEPLYRRALAIREKVLGDEHPDVAMTLNNLANLYKDQGRYAEAEPLHKRALAIRERALGDGHPDVAMSFNNLASLYKAQGRYAEAEPLHKRALAIREKALGNEHRDVAASLNNVANLYSEQERYADAESLYERVLTILEKGVGEQHPAVAIGLRSLANLYFRQGRYADAKPLMDRAISIDERVGMAPDGRSQSYSLRAQIGWKLGHQDEAISDLKRALDLAEQVRHQTSGAERERAGYFSQFGSAFEQMVAWQLQLGGAGEALQTIERSRARSLLDEMNLGGADLNAGRSTAVRKAIREKEARLKSRVAQLEKQFELATQQAGQSDQSGNPDVERLRTALAQARNDLYEQYRDERSSSLVYRNLIATGSGPPRISQLQKSLFANDDLALIYLFGEEGGYVVSLGPNEMRLASLTLDAPIAEVLGTSAGPLTSKRLQEILVGADNKGVVPQLATQPDKITPEEKARLTSRLAALWQVLIPAAERQALTGGKCKRLIVVPDGPLALLPFETLVVQGGQNPEYLLDNGPPILYAPSLSVLSNLAARQMAPPGKRKPVLTVADPVYPEVGRNQLASRDRSALGEVTSRSRYAGVGGQLVRLPFTAEESAAVADAFNKAGVAAGSLVRDQATEEFVRFNVSGRKIVHLACHGLTDQAYGNFFGALALTPSKQASTNPLDDGFLTLPEIYELDLKGCELAILSACQTNYGPQQQGEGVWALSRGFLVAGAKRVVASNWLVDDEAGANLITSFCAGLAADEKQGNGTSVDYASRLQAAKKSVRSQEKWRSPYYWSTFVLVGPN